MDAVAEYQPRRDHRLDLPGDGVGLAAARPRSSASTSAAGCRSSTSSIDLDAGGPAVRRHARGRQPHRQQRRAARRAQGEAPPSDGAPAPVHRRRARRRAATASPPREARARLDAGRRPRARRRPASCAGMIGDPDPYTAAMNALSFFRVDDIVISTLPGDALGLAARRPDRARAQAPPTSPSSTSCPAEAADPAPRPQPRSSHGSRRDRPRRRPRRRPPRPAPANRSSRVEPQLLGMLLFIISEVMVFGAFFTAYFFIRVVARATRGPPHGTELPVAVAGVEHGDPAVVVAHDALGRDVDQERQPLRPEGRDPHDVPARLHVPLHPDQRVRPHRLRPARQRPGVGLLRPHGPARRARLHRPAAAVDRHDPRLPRPLLARGRTAASRCRASTGTSSTSCGSSSTRRSTCSERAATRCAPRRRPSARCVYVVAVVAAIVVLVLVGRALF